MGNAAVLTRPAPLVRVRATPKPHLATSGPCRMQALEQLRALGWVICGE